MGCFRWHPWSDQPIPWFIWPSITGSREHSNNWNSSPPNLQCTSSQLGHLSYFPLFLQMRFTALHETTPPPSSSAFPFHTVDTPVTLFSPPTLIVWLLCAGYFTKQELGCSQVPLLGHTWACAPKSPCSSLGFPSKSFVKQMLTVIAAVFGEELGQELLCSACRRGHWGQVWLGLGSRWLPASLHVPLVLPSISLGFPG